MREDYGALYSELYRKHWWWRARERALMDLLVSRQPEHGWKRILDVGCGDALFFDKLLQFGDVEGVEPNEALLSPNGPHRSRIHVGSFDRLLKMEAGFSLILMLDVLEHFKDPSSALRYAMELLGAGGALIVTVPAFKLLWTAHDDLNQHQIRYTKQTFRKLARDVGLSIEIERYLFQWLFPLKIAVRVLEGVLRSQPTPAQVPASWINESLYRLSRLEARTWGRWHMPFGSSLLVLGRKQT